MAEYLANLTNGQLDEKGIFRLIGTLLTQSGVVQSGALAVSAQGTPDMTVKVAGAATGHDIVFITSSGDTYHGWNTADKNVTITANASGVTKTDAVVAYADLAAGIAISNNPGALKFVAVRRSGSDTGNPTSGEISSAVSSNPYVVLAYVTVTNGASSINSGNITDARVRAQVENSNLEPISGAQLNNSTNFGVSNKQLLNFVPRDTSSNTGWDLTAAGLAGGGWGTKSVQSIVGTKAVRVRLYVEWGATDARAVLMFAKGGTQSGIVPSNWTHTIQSIKSITSSSDVGNTGIIEVDLSTTQTIDTMYNVYGSSINRLNANVIGWYEPASTVT